LTARISWEFDRMGGPWLVWGVHFRVWSCSRTSLCWRTFGWPRIRDADESQVLGSQLRRLVAGGLGLLLVDHDMGLVLSVCDYIYVLDFGEVIAQGTPDEVRSDDKVVRAYLGTEAPR
jgi:hypothetical protein